MELLDISLVKYGISSVKYGTQMTVKYGIWMLKSSIAAHIFNEI